MKVIEVRNVHEALPEGIALLEAQGEKRESRNGAVLVMPVPVTTVFKEPLERVLFHPLRDANPFFHFIEGLWMLAGRNDVALPASYVKRMATFSDDGKTLHGAYGHRWRRHFLRHVDLTSEDGELIGGEQVEIDQLATIAVALKANPDDRRCVLQMWDAPVDLGRLGKDLPCNTHIYFTRDSLGALDMTVCCRSNDMVWGAYGANAVHMSMLQEYMAAAIGCSVGTYYQLSNNYHAYLDTFEPLRPLMEFGPPGPAARPNPYTRSDMEPFPMVSVDVDTWQMDLTMFLEEGMVIGFRDPFFRRVAMPIVSAHAAYRENEGQDKFDVPMEILEQCRALDWRLACEEWIERRREGAS